MAKKRWVSTDGNLSTAASWSPSGVPIANDSIYFDGSSNLDVLAGLTAFASVDLDRIWIQAAYQGNIGADGNALDTQAKIIIHNGSGSLYHIFGIHSATTPDYVVIDSPNLQDAYTLTDTNGAEGVDLVLACLGGGVNIVDNSNIVVGTMFVGGGSFSNQPAVSIGAISGNLVYRQIGGYVITKRALGSSGASGRAIIDGGTLVYSAEATAALAWLNLEITGGRVEYNGLGAITSCIVSSGTLDMTKDSRAKTITKLTLLPGSQFLTHDDITVTTLVDLRPDYPILGGSLP
jgi:hypothetical protein